MVEITQVNSNDYPGILALVANGYANLIHEGEDTLLVANVSDVHVTEQDVENINSAYDELLEVEEDEAETTVELESGQQVKVVR